MSKPIRFQHAPWYIKAGRLRFYLLVPFHAVSMWRQCDPADDLPLSFWWGLALGLAQAKMHWYYTTDEALK